MKNIFVILCVVIGSSSLYAQQRLNPEEVVMQVLESLAENDVDINAESSLFDDLIDLYGSPITLNDATYDQLEKLIFLSDLQVKSLYEYIQDYGPLSSKYQLQGISSLSLMDIKRLLLFAKIEPSGDIANEKKYLNGYGIVRDQFNWETAKGYQNDTASARYLGNKHHLYSKFQLRYGKNLRCGFVLDKDAGEQNWPVDFTSAYVSYESKKFIKYVVLGDYHANFGQGLAMWTGSSMGKTTDPLSIRKRGRGLRQYSSANESLYLRGGGITIGKGSWKSSVFGSYRERDASLSYYDDSLKIMATSFPETGYHRTSAELQKKNVVDQYVLGINLDYSFRKLDLSLGAVYQEYDVDSIQLDEIYKVNLNMKPKSLNYWGSYLWGHDKFVGFGDVAFDSKGGYALMNGLQFKPVSYVSLAILYRYFSVDYYAPWQNSFTENSNAAGESGYYIGLTVFPVENTVVKAYVDLFKTNWLKYQVDQPANGYDILFQIEREFNSHFNVYLLYKEKEKSVNFNKDEVLGYPTAIQNLKKIRAHADMKIDEKWSLQSRVERSYYQIENEYSDGMLAFVGCKYKSLNNKLGFWFRYVRFNTDDYDSRIYTYENDLLYNFSIPSFQEDGGRVYAMLKYQLFQNLKCWIKGGRTFYYNKEAIGSGLQEIEGNTRTTIKIQLQYKF